MLFGHRPAGKLGLLLQGELLPERGSGVLANSFDYVVIDGEAGIEQIQRRVMEKVTHLLLITDQSKKGAQVITTIKGVADDLIVYERIGAIINRMTNPELADMVKIAGLKFWQKSRQTATSRPTTSGATV